MQDISYSAALVPVRDDFAAAHTRFWKRLSSPGAWWTGAERVAIAAEVRQAHTVRSVRYDERLSHLQRSRVSTTITVRSRRRRGSDPWGRHGSWTIVAEVVQGYPGRWSVRRAVR